MKDGAVPEVSASLLALAYNAVVNRLLPDATHVPANLAAAGGLVALARRSGATWADLGLEPRGAGAAALAGLRAGTPAVVLIALGTALPATRRFLHDESVAGAGTGEVLYHTTLRIPLSTALAEETIFRGVLLGLFSRRHSLRTATALSSVLFGVWHVLPTLDTLETHVAGDLLGERRGARAAAVAVSVLTTALSGWGFARLRLRTGSILAPAVAHALTNTTSYVAARLAGRSRPFPDADTASGDTAEAAFRAL